jgi:hypothetical protein
MKVGSRVATAYWQRHSARTHIGFAETPEAVGGRFRPDYRALVSMYTYICTSHVTTSGRSLCMQDNTGPHHRELTFAL